MRRAFQAASLVVIVLRSVGVHAAEPTSTPPSEQAHALYGEGVRLYNVTEYERAIEKFKAAYLLSEDPELLFDIAQAYRRWGLGHCGQALEFYNNYERVLRGKGDPRPDVSREREECVRVEQKPDLPPAPAPSAAPPVQRADNVPKSPSEAPPPRRDSTVPVLAWSLLGAGTAALATGIVLWIGTRTDFSSLEASHCAPSCDPSRLRDIQTRERIGYGLGIAGMAVAGSGVVLLLVNRSGTSPLSAWLAPSGTGLVAGLRL